MKALKITDEHVVSDMQIKELKDLQAAVNGYIEYISFPYFDMAVNEEFLYQSENINTLASFILSTIQNKMRCIKGNVVLVGPVDSNGRTTEFTDELKTQLFNDFPVLKGRYIA